VNPVQKYELIYVLRVDQPESEVQARGDKAAAIIAEHKGEIAERSHWGVRKLAYQIDHQGQGDYTFFKFRSEGTAVAEIDRLFRQDDQCLRHLVVVDEEWPERNRASQARHRAAAAQAQSHRASALTSAPAPAPAKVEDEE
jgi:small subunit ribosomal protein S6